ncbi:MAG: nucleotidyltransferase family protein [Acidocella sp.]|nr:nucleotidyltransferase family protein [Acidocella sp.]
MEWLPPRLTDRALLATLAAILTPNPSPAALAQLRQRLYGAEFNWPALVPFAAGQDLLPPLIWALQTQHLLLPVPKGLDPARRAGFITTRLQDAYDTYQGHRRDLRGQLRACIGALNAAGITPLALKGGRYLLDAGSGWSSARPMRDVDLLIQPEQAPAAIAALTGIGFVADAPTGLQSHHLPELRLAGHIGAVELHTEALAPAGRRFMSTDFVFQQAVPLTTEAGTALVLPPAWQALHAMLHHQASDDGYNQRILALKPLWEFICLTGSVSDADWQALAAHMAAENGLDLLTSWCLQAEAVFNEPVPPGLAISAAARAQAANCLTEAAQPESLRRVRFLWRQLQRGFSAEMLAIRYRVPASAVGLTLRLRHLWFLLRRYRGHMRLRLLGQR